MWLSIYAVITKVCRSMFATHSAVSDVIDSILEVSSVYTVGRTLTLVHRYTSVCAVACT